MKMDDDNLLSLLRAKEDDSATYVWGKLGSDREAALREYYREPYGNEEEGWSQIVTSDVQDTVEWILPSLLEIFTSTDKAVSFEPSRAQDVKGAEQATDTCNYVFYKQNNGFLTLYTAFKDALTIRNCAVMWRRETKETVSTQPFKGASAEMLAMLMQEGGDDAEIIEANEYQGQDQFGNPIQLFDGRIKLEEKKETIKIEAFPPDELLIDRRWTSPLLQDCPYVCRVMSVTLSDLKEMGFDVLPEELSSSDGSSFSAESTYRHNRASGDEYLSQVVGKPGEEDDSLTEGFLRIEFVRVDYDGDGIAELRCIYRLQDKILKNDIVSHVPIATSSPMINTHRWDGMSVADMVGDLQKLHTELVRQTLNSAYLANNPRTKVLTDANWSPMANIDDLLDSRPGGIIRQRSMDAVIEHQTPFVAGATLPLLEYVSTMRENRTGVTRYNQGIDANSLNKTASGVNQIMTASQQRIKLIARVFAETLMKPIFTGILKLLTDGGMQKLAFRLRDEYVEYDPNEWRDYYDMTINVGLGTGDKELQAARLQEIAQNQILALQGGFAGVLVDPVNLYNVQAKLVENAGFKNVGDFWIDPRNAPPKQEQQQQDPIVQAEQIKAQAKQQEIMVQQQADAQKFQAEQMAEQQRLSAEIQSKEQIELAKIQSAERIKAAEIEAQKEAKLMELASGLLASTVSGETSTDPESQVDNAGAADPHMEQLQGMMQAIQQMASALSAPKYIVRDASGKAIGVQSA